MRQRFGWQKCLAIIDLVYTSARPQPQASEFGSTSSSRSFTSNNITLRPQPYRIIDRLELQKDDNPAERYDLSTFLAQSLLSSILRLEASCLLHKMMHHRSHKIQ